MVKAKEQSISIDVSTFNVDMEKLHQQSSSLVVIGLGATGSAFILLLGHFLKYHSYLNVHLMDFDYLESHNERVSIYGFSNSFGRRPMRNTKTSISKKILENLVGLVDTGLLRNNNRIYTHLAKVDQNYLNEFNNSTRDLRYIFIFTDSNESRYEIAKWSLENPEVTIFDVRIGTYDQFEVYMSNNPKKYIQTIYLDKLGDPVYFDEHAVCQDDRMSFSVAMTGASMIMNMFTKLIRQGYDGVDFKHVMIGNDFLGEVTGYE